jgi:hypothetical protein
MSSFDEEGLEGADGEEWGDAVEREDIGPVLYRLRFKWICRSELLRDKVWVAKGSGESGTTDRLVYHCGGPGAS